MSSSALCSCINLASTKSHRNWQLCYFWCRTFSKKYNYDLNNLIDWKNKTNLAFGSPRKCTKTGKLRKSQNNEKEQLKNTLELLSAQSDYFINCRKLGVIDFSDVLDIEITQDSYADRLEAKHEQSLHSPHSDDALVHEIFQKKPAANKKKTSKKIVNLDVEGVSFSTKADVKKENSNEDDIVIPVISPIPLGNNSMQKKSNDKKISKSSLKKSRSKGLPVEPPLSFSLINEIPLALRKHCMNDDFNNKISQFQEDVAALSFRTLPSVKSILSKTMPALNRFFLNRWRENMIKELGEEGFKVHQDATIKRGINFHANVMELLSGKPQGDIQVMPDNEGHWASLQTAIKDISSVEALEEDLNHSVLMYRGIMDCIAKYKDVLCVIDWKTSKKPRPLLKNTYDDPIQVAAYIGLVNDRQENVVKFGQVNHGLLVVLYPDGSPAHIHMMNQSLCEQYWQDWCERLYSYYQLAYTERFPPVKM